MSEQQFQEMFELQNKINTKIATDVWWQRGFNWSRAIWVESAELADHFSYKWWKSDQIDIEQSRLELVDIFHFMISFMLQKEYCTNMQPYSMQRLQSVYSNVVDNYSEPNDTVYQEVFLSTVDEMVGYLLERGELLLDSFFNLVLMSGMDLDDLHRMYVSKNVLNEFRQDNGYNDGTYIKIWNGKEDNEVLVEILERLDEITAVNIYNSLKAAYNEIR